MIKYKNLSNQLCPIPKVASIGPLVKVQILKSGPVETGPTGPVATTLLLETTWS